MHLPFSPPLPPMLAKLSDALPPGEAWLYEPKWDGFRAIVFRDGEELFVQSRDLKPLNRYFPELEEPLLDILPPRCVLDGEIVIAGPRGLDFEALLLRIHPAASRVAMLAGQMPASLVVWDLLAYDDEDLRDTPQLQRRDRLVASLGRPPAPVYVTPATRDRAVAQDWFSRFEGAGLDGVMAKRVDDIYRPDKRAMLKIKHARTADCVVAGFRWHKNGRGTMIGSLLLGLYDSEGVLQHVGVTSTFTMQARHKLVDELAPFRADKDYPHPWRHWQSPDPEGRVPGATSRWNRGKDLSWEPLRIERVCEVGYDHLQGTRFRHATVFKRWRPDKKPEDCRYDQLEETPPFELAKIFGGG
jgi:ATP-dependent DNA ligase